MRDDSGKSKIWIIGETLLEVLVLIAAVVLSQIDGKDEGGI